MAKKLPTISSTQKKSTTKSETKVEQKVSEEIKQPKFRPGSFSDLIS